MRLFGTEPEPPKERPKSGIKRTAGVVLVLFSIVIAAVGAVLLKAMPRMEKIIISSARSKASGEIDEAILNYMETNSITYGSLVKMHFDNGGAIASVTTDTAKIDALIARMDDEIGCELEEKLMETSIPLNVILGTELFAGSGPWVKVHFFPINIVNVGTRHEFTSRGINQTLHTIYLDVSVDIEILLPLKNKKTSVSTTVPIGQTLIVGGVPDTYVKR